MIASMTGFARGELVGPYGALTCETRSVNHRFLDATVRLAESCRSLEPELRSLLSRELKRGKIDCTLHHRAPQNDAGTLEIDPAALERVLARVRELATALPHHSNVDLVELLRFPGVLVEEQVDSEALTLAVRELFAATLRDLLAARRREGARLADLIRARCTALSGMIDAVRTRAPEVHARIRQRFQERLRELGAEVDPERMEQEILLMLQRSEISEELDRLDGHIEETRRALEADEPAGRRLDFLMQEFNREANTLSSKSQDLETTRVAVEMKVAIEQMREQVQNIE